VPTAVDHQAAQLLSLKCADLHAFLQQCQKDHPNMLMQPSESGSAVDIIVDPNLELQAKIEVSCCDLNLPKLLNFLQHRQEDGRDASLVLPWIGVPLPSIDLTLENALGLRVKFEFSLRLCQELIKHINPSGSAVEVAH
jgi:hypothetical protein